MWSGVDRYANVIVWDEVSQMWMETAKFALERGRPAQAEQAGLQNHCGRDERKAGADIKTQAARARRRVRLRSGHRDCYGNVAADCAPGLPGPEGQALRHDMMALLQPVRSSLPQQASCFLQHSSAHEPSVGPDSVHVLASL